MREREDDFQKKRKNVYILEQLKILPFFKKKKNLLSCILHMRLHIYWVVLDTQNYVATCAYTLHCGLGNMRKREFEFGWEEEEIELNEE